MVKRRLTPTPTRDWPKVPLVVNPSIHVDIATGVTCGWLAGGCQRRHRIQFLEEPYLMDDQDPEPLDPVGASGDGS